MDLGNKLKKARENKRLTQQQVADLLGVSNGAISGYERNYRDPDTETLKRLAELYDVSVDYLTGMVVKQNQAVYSTNSNEKIIIEEKLKLADAILNLPENEKKLVLDMVQALKDKRGK